MTKPSKRVWIGASAVVAAAVTGGAAAVYLVPAGHSHAAQTDSLNAVPAAAPQLAPIPVKQVVDPAARPNAPVGIQARTAYLYDAGKNRTLWSKGGDTKVAIGSMTKVMTALVVLQQGGLDRVVTIKPSYVTRVNPKTIGGSTASLVVGDKITVRELLYGLMLPSGCDAAAALADVYGPGYAGFVKKMNTLAAKLHLKSTHYSNFDGLSWSITDRKWRGTEAWSTAHDQVALGRYALKNATFRAVVGTAYHSLAPTRDHHSYVWQTTNHLLGRYPGANGIKTGHTDLAGFCLLFSDVRNGHVLIGAVLGDGWRADQSEVRFGDAGRMLDWALRTKTTYSLDKAAQGLPSD